MARVTQEPEAPAQAETDEEVNEVTRPSDLGFGNRREVEVEPINVPAPRPDDDGYTVVRMAVTIEEFTYGNNRGPVELTAGKMYRVPIHIAQYLHSLGKLYVTS